MLEMRKARSIGPSWKSRSKRPQKEEPRKKNRGVWSDKKKSPEGTPALLGTLFKIIIILPELFNLISTRMSVAKTKAKSKGKNTPTPTVRRDNLESGGVRHFAGGYSRQPSPETLLRGRDPRRHWRVQNLRFHRLRDQAEDHRPQFQLQRQRDQLQVLHPRVHLQRLLRGRPQDQQSRRYHQAHQLRLQDLPELRSQGALPQRTVRLGRVRREKKRELHPSHEKQAVRCQSHRKRERRDQVSPKLGGGLLR